MIILNPQSLKKLSPHSRPAAWRSLTSRWFFSPKFCILLILKNKCFSFCLLLLCYSGPYCFVFNTPLVHGVSYNWSMVLLIYDHSTPTIQAENPDELNMVDQVRVLRTIIMIMVVMIMIIIVMIKIMMIEGFSVGRKMATDLTVHHYSEETWQHT